MDEETHIPIPTSSLQHAAISERRSQSHQVPRASLGCHTGEHAQLMGKLGPPRYLGSSTVVPWFISLCFQRHLEVLPTQTRPCLVGVSPSNASLLPAAILLCSCFQSRVSRLSCTEDAYSQVYFNDVIICQLNAVASCINPDAWHGKISPTADKTFKPDVSLLASVLSFGGNLQGSSLGSITCTQLVSWCETLHPGAMRRAELAIKGRAQA